MTHLDLFSGIGGFALAAEWVWPDIEHTFVDNDLFCQAVLRKHWPNAKIYGDIRTVTNTYRSGLQEERAEQSTAGTTRENPFLLTGGFPCQPFSQAGRRKGTADDRFLWPEMARVIGEFKPTWVIAENVRGILTIEQGMVFEQVCLDLEGLGYEVIPFIIPAVAVNAPHRRDRVWIVAHAIAARAGSENGTIADEGRQASKSGREGIRQIHGTIGASRADSTDNNAPDTNDTGDRTPRSDTDKDGQTVSAERKLSQHRAGRQSYDASDSTSVNVEGKRKQQSGEKSDRLSYRGNTEWRKNWVEVAAKLCTLDDGLPNGLVRPRGWRNAALKAAGNAIVPQVAYEIMLAIKHTYETLSLLPPDTTKR